MNYKYNILQKGWIIMAHLFLCLLLLAITRLGFYLINSSYFTIDSVADYLLLSFYGIRFDLSALSILLGFPIVVLSLPLKWQYNNSKYWTVLFLLGIGLGLCFEIADWKYFSFNQKRSNIDVLYMLSRPSDFLALLPSFIKDYGYLFLIALALFFLLYAGSRKIFSRFNKVSIRRSESPIWLQLVVTVIYIGFIVVGIRGGAQLVPITTRNAIAYASNENVPLVLNTTFNIVSSAQNEQMALLTFTDTMTLNAAVPAYHLPQKEATAFQKKNLVIVVMESFSKEFTALGNGKSYTPFIDSLMQYSYVFTNAYANAFQSAQAIPAILAGIPAWMDQSFMTSAYANNNINSFANLLQPFGYTSTFYHGATNGSMSFDIFSKNAGYQRYFGRSEYNNEKDYDGNWGIWDEPFLQAVAKDMNQQQQPFHATVFNLNSHPPYEVPKAYASVFVEGELPIHKALRYSDYAFQQFFKAVSTQAWFKNTLFVFTADHCSPMASSDFYQNYIGKFQIPIFIFDPTQTILPAQTNHQFFQQIDLLPTILDTLAYPKSYYALGKTVWKNEAPFIMTKIGDTYYTLSDSMQFVFFDYQLRGAYLFPKDSLNENDVQTNSIYQPIIKTATNKFLFQLQLYNNDMINNKMFIAK